MAWTLTPKPLHKLGLHSDNGALAHIAAASPHSGHVAETAGGTISVTTAAELTTALSNLAAAPSLAGDVIISLASGTYASNFTIPSLIGNGYTLTISGSKTATVSTSATGGTAGNATTQPTVIKAAAGWTANAYRGMWCYFTSGTNNGKIRVINSNDATTLTLCGALLPAAPGAGDTFEIRSNAASITGNTVTSPSTCKIILQDVNIGDFQVNSSIIDCIRIKHTVDEYLAADNKWVMSYVRSKESYHLCNAGLSYIYFAGTQFVADRCLFYGNKGVVFTALISQGGSHTLFRNGSVLDNFDVSLYCDVGGTGQCNDVDSYGVESNTNVFVKNSSVGEQAVAGGVILNDATTFSGCVTNKNPAAAADPAYIS